MFLEITTTIHFKKSEDIHSSSDNSLIRNEKQKPNFWTHADMNKILGNVKSFQRRNRNAVQNTVQCHVNNLINNLILSNINSTKKCELTPNPS